MSAIPILVIWMIPFVGYAAPLIGYFYPSLIPNVFRTRKQKVTK